jgi:hypothetical protein
MQAGTQAAEAEMKALRIESNRFKEEASRLREERQVKEKELADTRLELATIRRTSDVATESLKSGIISYVSPLLSIIWPISLIKSRALAPQGRKDSTRTGSASAQELEIDT